MRYLLENADIVSPVFLPIVFPVVFFSPQRTQWEETQGTQLNANHNRGPLEYHFSILSIENPNPLNLLLQK